MCQRSSSALHKAFTGLLLKNASHATHFLWDDFSLPIADQHKAEIDININSKLLYIFLNVSYLNHINIERYCQNVDADVDFLTGEV